MEDAISKYFLVPRAGFATFLNHLGILVNVLAPRDGITSADVFQVEHPPMLVAAVAKAKVDAGAVLGGGPHEVAHNALYVEGQLPLWSLRHLLVARKSWLRSTTGINLFLVCFSLLLT